MGLRSKAFGRGCEVGGAPCEDFLPLIWSLYFNCDELLTDCSGDYREPAQHVVRL